MPRDKEEKKKMPEVEKSSFEDDFTFEEQKKPSKKDKLSFEEVKLPAANDQGFSNSNTFKGSIETESAQD